MTPWRITFSVCIQEPFLFPVAGSGLGSAASGESLTSAPCAWIPFPRVLLSLAICVGSLLLRCSCRRQRTVGSCVFTQPAGGSFSSWSRSFTFRVTMCHLNCFSAVLIFLPWSPDGFAELLNWMCFFPNPLVHLSLSGGISSLWLPWVWLVLTTHHHLHPTPTHA